MQPRHLAHQKLHPQQEKELVQYIQRLTERRTPPTREMIRNFAGTIAGSDVSDSWVSLFLNRNSSHLISRWQTGMDRQRHQADSGAKYSLYFSLLHQKIEEYKVKPGDIYNIDEKGFLAGITGRSKRVFNRRMWERKEVTAGLQDGSREWVTLLACICADGSALPPSLIFQSTSGDLQASWVEDIKEGEHSVFVTSSPSGWTNNEIGVAWLKQVFDRFTRSKSYSSYRLLLLDGHGSHVTQEFLEYCDQNKILLCIFPPHSTHTLQPLDVVMFKPLSTAYSKELSNYLHNSQGLLSVKKGDFFPLFWRAWVSSFRKNSIQKSFTATGIWPPDPSPILKRFNRNTPEISSSDESSSSVLSGSDWLKIKSLIQETTSNKRSKEVKKLNRSLHHISVEVDILRHENMGLKEALSTKKEKRKKSHPLHLRENQGEYHGGAVFCSPRKLRQAKERRAIEEREKDELRLQKAQRSQLKKQVRLYKLQVAQEKRVERERLKEVREKEKAEQVAERARQKADHDSRKAFQQGQNNKRKASQASSQNKKRQKRVVAAAAIKESLGAAPAAPPVTTRRGRNIKLPSKYK